MNWASREKSGSNNPSNGSSSTLVAVAVAVVGLDTGEVVEEVGVEEAAEVAAAADQVPAEVGTGMEWGLGGGGGIKRADR